MTADALVVDAFTDLRSPYSYVALKPARDLAARHGVTFDWWPYITDMQGAYGGEVEERSPRDVAKVKYLYMDCRRLAKPQGLTIRGTVKLWDARLASQAFLFAKGQGRLWEFLDPMLAAFWRRAFDLESADALEAALVEAGLSAEDWREYRAGPAASDLEAVMARADALGVFGAPTFILDGELFWGGDRLAMLAGVLAETGGAPQPSSIT